MTLFKVDLPQACASAASRARAGHRACVGGTGRAHLRAIPGTNYVGIEVPNRTRQSVLLGDVIKDADEGPLQIVIGKDVEGRSIVSDLAKMPTCSSAALPVRASRCQSTP